MFLVSYCSAHESTRKHVETSGLGALPFISIRVPSRSSRNTMKHDESVTFPQRRRATEKLRGKHVVSVLSQHSQRVTINFAAESTMKHVESARSHFRSSADMNRCENT